MNRCEADFPPTVLGIMLARQRAERILAQLQPNNTQAHCSPSSSHSLSSAIRLSPSVAAALRAGRPVLALESTIISHGMPYPQNLDTARRVERVARENGAEPATIAVMDGRICVGLDDEQLQKLAKAGPAAHKCSRRDMASVLAKGQGGIGATTVSGTMVAAELAGIPVFATGGIGGVHRGAESSMDVSADLIELGRTPVAVVCAGVKSILDIPRTLEVLETHGVSVTTIGAEDREFPAFFTRRSGCKAAWGVDGACDAARIIHASHSIGLKSGSIFAVPIPPEHEAAGEEIEVATQRALREVEEKKIAGRDVTPYLLQRINELTSGRSLQSNIALVLNNVKVGAQIAVELAKLRQQNQSQSQQHTPSHTLSLSSSIPSRFPLTQLTTPLVIGGTNLDLLGRPAAGSHMLLGTSNPGHVTRCWGGVGRNVAETLGRLRANPVLLSAIGMDIEGERMMKDASAAGIDVRAIHRSARHPTSMYVAILDEKGDLFTTIAQMDATDEISVEHLPSKQALNRCPFVILDGNVSHEVIREMCRRAAAASSSIPLPFPVPVLFEPTSIEKCIRGVDSLLANEITFLTPSSAELLRIKERVEEIEGRENTAGSAALVSRSGVKAAATVPPSSPSSSSVSNPVVRDAYEHNHDAQQVEQQCLFILRAIHARYVKTHQRQQHSRPLRPVHILLKRGALGATVASMLPDTPSASTLMPPTASSTSTSAPAPSPSPATASRLLVRHIPTTPLPRIVNTSGAGDTFVGAFSWSLMRQADIASKSTSSPHQLHRVRNGYDIEAIYHAVEYGMSAAEMTLLSPRSVAEEINSATLEERVRQRRVIH